MDGWDSNKNKNSSTHDTYLRVMPLANFHRNCWRGDKTHALLRSAKAGRLYKLHCGRPWLAAYINFNQNTHQIQVLTKPLCRAQAIFYSPPNNERGTKYQGLTYSAK